MKCLCKNTHNIDDKWEKLEATVLLKSYDIVVIIETWWNKVCGVWISIATSCPTATGEE